MALKMRIYCATHDDAPVIPAGDEFHWLPQSHTNQDTGKASVEFELDGADLYCTGKPVQQGEEDHVFVASVRADTKENGDGKNAGCHIDGLGHDIIV